MKNAVIFLITLSSMSTFAGEVELTCKSVKNSETYEEYKTEGLTLTKLDSSEHIYRLQAEVTIAEEASKEYDEVLVMTSPTYANRLKSARFENSEAIKLVEIELYTENENPIVELYFHEFLFESCKGTLADELLRNDAEDMETLND